MWCRADSQVTTSVLEGDYASFFRAEKYFKKQTSLFWRCPFSFSHFLYHYRLSDRKQRVHNCSETEHVDHIFLQLTFTQFSILQPNPLLCYRLFLFLSDSFTTHSLLLRFSGVIFLGFLSTLSLFSNFLLFSFIIPPLFLSTLPLNIFNYVI